MAISRETAANAVKKFIVDVSEYATTKSMKFSMHPRAQKGLVKHFMEKCRTQADVDQLIKDLSQGAKTNMIDRHARKADIPEFDPTLFH